MRESLELIDGVYILTQQLTLVSNETSDVWNVTRRDVNLIYTNAVWLMNDDMADGAVWRPCRL